MKALRSAPVLVCLLLMAAALAPTPAPAATRPPSIGIVGDPPNAPCPLTAPDRYFDVVALMVPISYNHWGDYDPLGRLFVLESERVELLQQVAGELAEAGLATAEKVAANPTGAPGILGYKPPATITNFPTTEPFDVSPLVRPLVVRAHVGDCVQFNLTNELAEPVSFHVHGARALPGDGMNLGTDPDDLAQPGTIRPYRYWIPDEPAMEGAHFFHSHADARYQTKHGLFGALVAEPKGSSWRTPGDAPSVSGTQAMIVRPGAADFREFVVVYHDEVELIDRHQSPLAIVSRYGEYGPGTKAINYRTEPFMDRFLFHDDLAPRLLCQNPNGNGKLLRCHDKSQGYGSYTYGDGAQFRPESYVGDPAKWRLLNAGPGQHHVHHLHGGGDRWRVSPVADDTQFDDGLVKVNPIIQSASDRVDVQSIGPGESFNAEIEGGSGGVQQSVGDFLFHCHIAEHYVGGMWSFWRVLNTLQDGLEELPDRKGLVPQHVNSTGLIGRTMPDGTVIDEDNLDDWIRPLLPAQGPAFDDDASVWDWTTDGTLYRGEPETDIDWPNYHPAAPGERPEIRLNPVNGRLAFPLLQPHFGKRPPFAPEHGPAPYLGRDVEPGRPDGLCPAGAPARDYRIVAMQAVVPYNTHGDVDLQGQIFAHAEDKAAIEAGTKDAKSLVIRANQGDCVDVLLTSDLLDTPVNGDHSKVNMHIHLVQFDVQGSDGVISGFNYETSVRPAGETGTHLTAVASAGATTLTVQNGGVLFPGDLIGVSLTEPTVEIRLITGVSGNTITIDGPLVNSHPIGDRVGTEFVRYRWYADVDLGMVYWHDHVDGLNSWRHGLFGGLVVEPASSTWRDPKTGSSVLDGHVIDVVGPNGNFREYVVQFQERSACVPGDGGCSDGAFLERPNPERELASINLRSEPLHERNDQYPLRSGVGNESAPATPQGDPATDLWRAYPGDPVMIRFLYAGQSSTRSVGTFVVTGHRFPFEPNLAGAKLVEGLSAGISSQHNLRLDCGAGSCAELPGDYLYYLSQPDLLERGAWGVFRVYDAAQSDLLTLPGNEDWSAGTLPGGTVRHYDVVALETTVVFNSEHDREATVKLFATADDADDIENGNLNPQPLVLRALPGEVVEVTLENRLDEPVSLNAGLLLADPADGLGIPVGNDPDTLVPAGDTRTYTWVADKEFGAVRLTSFADPDRDALDGLYAALVIEPAGSTFAPATGPRADVTLVDGRVAREHVLLYASDDEVFEASVMPYRIDVDGLPGINYRIESLNDRVGQVGHHSCHEDDTNCVEGLIGGKQIRKETRNLNNSKMFDSEAYGDPETPILDATQGQYVVVRALAGAGDQLVVHHLSGHAWRRDPGLATSNLVDSETLGPGETSNAWFVAGEAGAGDYWWGNHRQAFTEAGQWGLLRVS